MANRYWVGGTGTWDTTSTTNWSATTGGTAGASVPTAADSVFFDQAATYTVTLTGALTCLDITTSGATGTATFAGAGSLAISGSMTLKLLTSWNTGPLTFNSTTTGKTITTNGITISSSMTFNGVGGGWTLGSALNINSGLTITAGDLNTSASNFAITCLTLSATSASTSSLTLNASTVTISFPTALSLTGTGFTLNAGTSTINLTSGTGITFNSKGLTFYNVAFTVSSPGRSHTISGVNTFNNLSFPATATAGVLEVIFSANQTINGTFTGSGGSAPGRIFYRSDILGTARTLTRPSPTTLTNCDFRDITAATSAITATGGGDCGGNTNITGFPAAKTVYWNLTGTQSWNATAWATTSGGIPAVANYPLAQDTAVFDNLGAATIINFAIQGCNVGTINMSARTTAMTLNTSNPAPNVYGSWLNGTGVTLGSAVVAIPFVGRGGVQTITGNGVTFNQLIDANNIGGTVRLLSVLTSTKNFSLTNGTLDLNNFQLTVDSFSSNNSNTRSIVFGTGNITINTAAAGTVLDMTTMTGFTFTGTSNFIVSPTYSSTGAIQTSVGSVGATSSNAVNVTFTGSAYNAYPRSNGYRNLTYSSFTGYTDQQNTTLGFYGNLILAATMSSFIVTGLYFLGSGSVTTNGVTINAPIFVNSVGGTIQLSDNLTMGSTRTLNHTDGTLNLNGKTLTVGTSYVTQTGTKNLTFNGGTLVCTGTTQAFHNFRPIGFTITAGIGVGKISMTSASPKTFIGASFTFNCNLSNDGAGDLTITGTNVFTTLSNTGQNSTIILPSGVTTTLANININGDGITNSLVGLNSSTAGTQATVSLPSGYTTLNFISLRDINFTGGCIWDVDTNCFIISNVSGTNAPYAKGFIGF